MWQPEGLKWHACLPAVVHTTSPLAASPGSQPPGSKPLENSTRFGLGLGLAGAGGGEEEGGGGRDGLKETCPQQTRKTTPVWGSGCGWLWRLKP